MSSPKPSLDELRIERKPAPERRSNPGLVVVVVIILLLAGAGIWWNSRSSASEVRTETVRETSGGRGQERTVLNASGYVTARRQATVSSKVTGKVVEVLIEEGMKVDEGQVLAKLDDTNTKTSLRLAEAQLDSAQTSLEETRALYKQADKEYQRTIDLAQQKIASPSDLDKAEADAVSLKARLARLERDVIVAQRQVEVWERQMDDLVIRAPFAGIVTTKDAQPGEMISPVSAGGGFTRTGIGTVVDMKSLEIEIDVNESYINRVEPKQPVEATLDAYPDWKIPCKVIAIIPTADRQKATVKVRVGFDQLDPRILPEMSVKVAFRDAGGATQSSHEIIVPKRAVRQKDGQDVVLVVQNGKVERRQIKISGSQDEEVTVTSGVSAGEQVVVESDKDLAEGTVVKEKKL
jgi:RND family efflux transporter MFP subunit